MGVREHLAAKHHGVDPTSVVDVGEGIVGEDDEIGRTTRGNGAEPGEAPQAGPIRA